MEIEQMAVLIEVICHAEASAAEESGVGNLHAGNCAGGAG